jgi:hypothetical protein
MFGKYRKNPVFHITTSILMYHLKGVTASYHHIQISVFGK